MEDDIALGRDLGALTSGIKELTNRDDVLGSAHDLSDWLDAHLIS
ncbi:MULTISPECIES: hypothetical protein [unclassified Streptomyces]|jgi:hypothetical protein|nr:hypothetical protein [Streptomyces sp. CB02400]